MNDQLVAPATPLELATEHVHDAMQDAWNDPNPPREEAETEAARKVLSTALDGIDIPALLGEHWNWWHPNHVPTCMCGTALDAKPGQAIYPALHRHQDDLIRASILGGAS